MYEELKRVLWTSKRLVFFGGAGVSTESGIPDFRSDHGLYSAREQYGHSPEELLSHTFYRQKPKTFFDYYKNNLIYRDGKPNRAHYALAKLEAEGNLLAVVTQNIDGLHQMAGSKRIYELHGSVRKNTCTGCGAPYDLDYVMEPSHCIDAAGSQGQVPYCEACHSVIKPDVVLYEEALDESVLHGAIDAISQADTLVVGGTSLVVYPAAGLIRYFQGDHLILINKTETQYDSKARMVFHESIGEVLGACVLD